MLLDEWKEMQMTKTAQDIATWPMPQNRAEFEAALDAHRLYAAMRNGHYWQVRRNGQTKLWKTRPMDWSIPVKAGLKSCAQVEFNTFKPEYWRIEPR